MATYKFVTLDDAAADKAIMSIRSTGAKLRRDIHQTAVGLVMHMQEHGRHTKFISLCDAVADTMGKNQRKSFIEWVLAFTWLTYNEDTKEFAKDKSKEIKLEDAKATPFWEMEREVASKPVDIQKIIREAISRASKAAEKGNITNEGDTSFLDYMAAAAASYVKPAATEVVKNDTSKRVEEVAATV